MDNQKKQTDDHEKLVREWLNDEGKEAEIITKAKYNSMGKQSFYAVFTNTELNVCEIINDRYVKLHKSYKWRNYNKLLLSKGKFRVRLSLDGIGHLTVPESGDRISNFLKGLENIDIIEYERSLWSRLTGK